MFHDAGKNEAAEFFLQLRVNGLFHYLKTPLGGHFVGVHPRKRSRPARVPERGVRVRTGPVRSNPHRYCGDPDISGHDDNIPNFS